jgi:hypothetical protein
MIRKTSERTHAVGVITTETRIYLLGLMVFRKTEKVPDWL